MKELNTNEELIAKIKTLEKKLRVCMLVNKRLNNSRREWSVDRVNSLQEEIEESGSIIEKLDNRLADTRDENNKLKEEIEQHGSIIEKLDDRLADARDEIKKLKDQKYFAIEIGAARGVENQKLKEEIRMLKDENKKLKEN
tara:strand:+ start:400 stop:822 length:423 start_codon:yes stop_codon:yes gene_type:complete